MLKRATVEDLPYIRQLCSDSIVGTKILCYILAYGFDRDFLEVWIIVDGEEITGVITVFYGDAALFVKDNADAEQIKAFLGMLHFNTLMCSEKNAMLIGFENLKLKNGYRFISEASAGKVHMLDEQDYKRAYTLISKEIPGSFHNSTEAYLSFLSDFTFRKRRNLARGVCTYNENELSSVALTSSETETAAVLSGVACDSNFRKKGLGKTTVLSLVKLLTDENKTAYVIALNKSAEGFYEHIGFEKKENIAFIEREKDV